MGAILPHSSTILTESDIEKKILKARKHISNLKINAGSSRNTHGGKAFRAKRISLKSQSSEHSKRLELLRTAQTLLGKKNESLTARAFGTMGSAFTGRAPFLARNSKLGGSVTQHREHGQSTRITRVFTVPTRVGH